MTGRQIYGAFKPEHETLTPRTVENPRPSAAQTNIVRTVGRRQNVNPIADLPSVGTIPLHRFVILIRSGCEDPHPLLVKTSCPA